MEISFEFFPPKMPEAMEKLLDTANHLATIQPDYFSVTFGAGGSTRTHTPDTVYAIKQATQCKTIPHISCMGSSQAQLLALLNDYQKNGIRDLLVLRGDRAPDTVASDFTHANELVTFIRQHFDNTFHLSVSAYPEPHPESKNLETELHFFSQKILSGADRAITQYFYNPDAYFYFCERVRKQGITTEIIPGIMPITHYDNLKRFSQFCGAEIPLWIRRQLDAYTKPEDVERFGFEVVLHLCETLLKGGAPGIHFYTLNKAEPSLRLAHALGA